MTFHYNLNKRLIRLLGQTKRVVILLDSLGIILVKRILCSKNLKTVDNVN